MSRFEYVLQKVVVEGGYIAMERENYDSKMVEVVLNNWILQLELDRLWHFEELVSYEDS